MSQPDPSAPSSFATSGESAAERRDLTIRVDAQCRNCGYNLRGLAGDPIRCPECFREYALADLLDLHSPQRRIRELQGAGDALLLATLSLAAGAALTWLDGLFPLGAPLLVIGGLLVDQSLRATRRLGGQQPQWSQHLSRYYFATCAIPLAPAAVWLAGAILVWTVRVSLHRNEPQAGATSITGGLDLVDFGMSLPLATLVLMLARPLRRLRRFQRGAFAALVKMVSDGSAGMPEDQPEH